MKIALLARGNYVLVQRRCALYRSFGVDCIVVSGHESQGVHLLQRYRPRWMQYAKLLPSLVSRLETFRPDVLEGHGVTSYGAIAALLPLRHRPLRVCVAYGTDVYDQAAASSILRSVARASLRRADLVYASSSALNLYTSEALQYVVEPERLVVIPWGTQLADESIADSDSNALRQHLKVGADAFVAIHPRRLSPHWRLPFLVKALGHLRTIIDRSVELWLVFTTPTAREQSYLAEIAVLCESAGVTLRLLGPQPHPTLLRLMAAADVFLCSAMRDMLSNSILDAMHSQCIPVLSDIEAYRSLRNWSTQGVLLVDPADPSAWASAMAEVASWTPAEYGLVSSMNRAAVMEQGDDRHTAQALLDEFDLRLGQRTSRGLGGSAATS